MDLSRFHFDYRGKRIGVQTYGASYISEFCRVLETHADASTGRVLEWGSGLTTQALAHYGVETWKSEIVLSIDDNAEYQRAIFRDRVPPACLSLKTLDLKGPSESQSDRGYNYSTYPIALGKKFDLIFIDGRRRMECAFIAALVSTPASVVILHDYRRERYQPIMSLFESIEDGPQFRVMRPRQAILDALPASRHAA